jgi:hypothetical protein
MAGPGRPKTGGRAKGVRNKTTLRREAAIQALCPPGDDPLTFWAHILKDKTAPLDIRHAAAKELAPFMHPKLASIEARQGGSTYEQRLEEARRMLEDLDRSEI